MNAGQMRERVTIQRLTRATDPATGAVSQTWAYVATRWASIKPVDASEQPGESGQDMVAPFLVSLRAPVDLTERDRLSWRNRILNIQRVTESVPGVRFDLTCVETR